MQIGKKYKIESDSLNVTLYERQVSRKTKQEYWTAIGYYSNPANALKALVDLKVNETGLREFKIVVDRISELHTLIDGLDLSRDALQSVRKPLEASGSSRLPRKVGVKKCK